MTLSFFRFFRQGDLAEPFTMLLTDIEAVMGQLSGIQVRKYEIKKNLKDFFGFFSV